MTIVTIIGSDSTGNEVAKERVIGNEGTVTAKAEQIAASWRSSGLQVELVEKTAL